MNSKVLVFLFLVLATIIRTGSAKFWSGECEPGSKFKKACNLCVCNAFGTGASCDEKECRYVCAPGKHFVQDCNYCYCDETGLQFYCTEAPICPHKKAK